MHGKVRLRKTGEGLQGVSLQARDGIRVERKSHVSRSTDGVTTAISSDRKCPAQRTFEVAAESLQLESTLVRFPRNTVNTPANEDSKVS